MPVKKKRVFDLKIAIKPSFYQHISLAYLVITIGLISYYIIYPSRGEFHSDSADTIMWAQASIDSGSLFNHDFHYAALLPFGGNLIMTPLVGIFGLGMTAQIIGMMIFFAIFTAAIIFLLKQLGWSWTWIFLSTASFLAIVSSSAKLREIFWGHIIYYSLGVLYSAIGLALVYKAIDLVKNRNFDKKSLIIIGGIILWFAFSAVNLVNVMVIFNLPVLLAIVGERYFRERTADDDRAKTILIASAAFLGTCLGGLVGILLTKGYNASYATAYSNFQNPNEWFSNIEDLLMMWITLLGFDISADKAIVSSTGIQNMLRIFMGLILAAVPFIALKLYRRIKDIKLRLFIMYHVGLTGILLTLCIFGALLSANWRLSPLLFSSVLIGFALCRFLAQNKNHRRFIALFLIPTLAFSFLSLYKIARMPADYQNDRYNLKTIIEALEERDLTYGYATFWRANSITVLSDSKIKVRDVTVDKSLVSGCAPRRYQTNDKWYKDQPGQDKYFLLLSDEEYLALLEQEDFLGANKDILLETHDYNFFYIIEFSSNIF